jgi:hypothetical protein
MHLAELPYYRSLHEITGAPPASTLPITPNDPIYLMAQQAVWLDGSHFAIGRWNGIVSAFDASEAPPQAPLIEAAVASPAGTGVQMLAAGDGSWFASLNDTTSLSIWAGAPDWSSIELIASPTFDARYGVATCGLYTPTASGDWLLTGHDKGYLLIWDAGVLTAPTLQGVVELQSSSPTNPWNLQTIRQIAPLDIAAGQAIVVTGSENGNLSMVSAPSGAIIDTVVYNPAAQRGINTVAVQGQWVLAGNCAVGAADKNLWCYDTSSGGIVYTDSTNLVVDTSLPQVFNFSVSWGGDFWFAATEEGALWGGTVSSAGQLQVAGYDEVSAKVGAATTYGGSNELVVAAFNVHTFVSD